MERVKRGALIRLAAKAAGIKETNAPLLRGRRRALASVTDGCGLTAELICIMHPHRVIDQRRSAVVISSHQRRKESAAAE